MYFLHSSSQPHTEKEAELREGGLMLRGLCQAEQMHNFIMKEVASSYELPLLSLPLLSVAFAFLESEPTTQKKKFIFSFQEVFLLAEPHNFAFPSFPSIVVEGF